mgnify:CR=1 FL=1
MSRTTTPADGTAAGLEAATRAIDLDGSRAAAQAAMRDAGVTLA